jgi:hypothetical protein
MQKQTETQILYDSTYLSYLKKSKSLKQTINRMKVARDWGKRERELRVSVLQMKEFWKWMVVMVKQQYECAQCH